jgi:sugar lactone lactonase YvrE
MAAGDATQSPACRLSVLDGYLEDKEERMARQYPAESRHGARGKAPRAKERSLLGAALLLMLAAGRPASAVTYVTVDGHPKPVTLTVGETVIVRCDTAKAGSGLNVRMSLDLAGTGKYDPTSPLWPGPGVFGDGGGTGDQDPAPGKIAHPVFISPFLATGRYILRLEDSSDGSAVELPGVTILPKPEAQSISGRVSLANSAGAPPSDALVWAYADASTPVASTNIKPDGSYTLPLPPGTYVVFAEWFGSLRAQRQTLNLVAGQQRTGADFPLIEGQEVSGTVRSSGQAAADAVVQAVLANGATVGTKTFSDGSYSLALPRGQHQITAMGLTTPVVVTNGPVDGVDFPPAAAGPTPAPGTIVTIAGNGISGYGGDGQPAVNARLTALLASVQDRAGNLYFSMAAIHRVRRIDAKSGIITTIAGSAPFELVRGLVPGLGLGAYGGDGGPATQALLFNPQHLALDAAGNLYISEVFNHRVRKVDPNGIITTVVGTGKEGFSGDGGPAAQAQLAGPQGVVVDREGNLYIGDNRNRRVRKVDAKGIISTVAGGGTEPLKDGVAATSVVLPAASCLALDGAGNLYIGGGALNRLLKVTPAGILSSVAGTGTAGLSGDGGPATQAQLNARFPYMAVDSAGNLFFTDESNHRVRKISAEGIITTVAGSVQGYAGDGGPATEARLLVPGGIAIDGAGNVIFTDRGNHRIRKVIGIAAPGLFGGQ